MRRLVLLTFLAACSAPAERELVEVRGRDDIARELSSTAKLHVVNLWATWCVPCVAEMPDLQKVDNSFSERDVQLVGVSLDSAIPAPTEARKALVRQFLDSRKIKFKILYYIGKPSKIADEYDFDGEIPLTIVYDRSGRELMRHKGVISAAKLTGDLKALVEKTN